MELSHESQVTLSAFSPTWALAQGRPGPAAPVPSPSAGSHIQRLFPWDGQEGGHSEHQSVPAVSLAHQV